MTTIKSIIIINVRQLIVPALIFFVVMHSNATTYYTRSSGANWSSNLSWSTVTYAGAAAAGHPIAGDTVNIANGITVIVNTTSACSVINIGQGTSGILQFGSTGSFTLTVSGNINISNGAKLFYNSNNARTHSLKVGGDIVNNGIVDLYYDVDDIVNVIFDGASNSEIAGTGSWALNNVTLNKSSAVAELKVSCTGFEAAIASLLSFTGTYIHNNSGSYYINSASASAFVISENVVFKVPIGTVWFSKAANIMYLEGSLYVSGGSVFVGTTAGNNGLVYRKPGSVIPILDVTGGSLNVFGGIYNSLGDPFNFKMTGGTMLLNNGSAGTSQGIFSQNDVAGSQFYMSGGTITIEKHNSNGATNVDWGICGTNGLVTSTGGTIQFGDNSTPTGTVFDFIPFPTVIQPNFKVTGSPGAIISLQPSKSSIDNFQLLSLYIDVNKTFDIRSILGVPGDSRIMTLTSTYNGADAFTNKGIFNSRLGTVIFSGSAPQSIGGNTLTTFYNLTMNANSDVTLSAPENVSNFLSMAAGKLITTSTNILSCLSSANADIGTSGSYVVGPMIQTIAGTGTATKIFPIGDGTAYRPAVLTVSHLTSTSVTYQGQVVNSSAAALGYNLPSTIAKVSTTRYWDFTRQNVSNLSNAVIKLYYDLDDSVTDKLKVRVVHDNGSFIWIDYAGSATANNTGNITSTSITSFKSKFALGFPPASLPIELISFEAKKTMNKVNCKWATASEINNDYFTIQRSVDGIHYDSLLNIKGAGNNTTVLYYEATDEHPLTGDSYYRLRQTDYNGNKSYSEAVHVYMEKVESSYNIFPNPSESNLIHIEKNGEEMNNAEVIVHDLSGKEVKTIAMLSADKREMQLSIDPSSLNQSNAFIVSILRGNNSVKEKVLINKH